MLIKQLPPDELASHNRALNRARSKRFRFNSFQRKERQRKNDLLAFHENMAKEYMQSVYVAWDTDHVVLGKPTGGRSAG